MARTRQSARKPSTNVGDAFPDFDLSKVPPGPTNPFPPFEDDRPKAITFERVVPMGLSAVAKELEELQSMRGALGPHLKEYEAARLRLGEALGEFQRPDVEEARQRLKAIMGGFNDPDIEEARQRLKGIIAELNSPAIDEAKERLGSAVGDLASIAEEAQNGLLGSRAESVAEQFLREEQKRISSLGPVLPPIELPRNPIHKTNEHLAATNVKIDALIQVQAKQTDLVDALLAANVAGSATQERLAKANVRLTIMSVILGLCAVLAAFLGVAG